MSGDDAAPRRPSYPRRRWVYLVAGLGVLWFLVGGFGGSFQGKLAGVQNNDSSAFLPGSAESTEVSAALRAFDPVQTLPAFVVYHRASGLTAADRQAITQAATRVVKLPGVAGDQAAPPRFSADRTTAALTVPLVSARGGTSVDGTDLVTVEKRVVAAARAGAPTGLAVHGAGPGGLLVATIDSFTGLDGTLLLVAGAVVVVILLLVYRSPVLWFFPLFSAVLGLGASALIIYPLAKHGVLTLNGQSQGILSVLVLGAGTDYALLLVSRYREELRRHPARVEAMIAAWRGTAPAIAASAITVILGLLCLTFSELNSDRSLGPVCAIGIFCTAAIMLTFLPLALLVGRWIFWPRIPRVDPDADAGSHGRWDSVAAAVTRRPRRVWIATTLALVAVAFGLTQLRAGGLATTESFTNTPDAVVGQRLYDAKFAAGSSAPAVVLADATKADAVVAAVRGLPGVQRGDASVCVAPDYRKLARAMRGGSGSSTGPGCPPPEFQVRPVGGRVPIDVVLADPYDSQGAVDAVTAVRAAVHAVPGAHAIVGGQTATLLDTRTASAHDRNLIIPIVLAVILVVLALLLRALLVPVLLVASVVLSFAATLGISALVFDHLFHFAGADPGFPLFAFVFLVALGVDYNIFLMTRVREETLRDATRPGVRRGLAATGSVITSAGVVLAATFAVLCVLPLVALAEIGFAVALGVLLDTVLVRSVLVPALCADIGPAIWWPSRLR